MKLFAYFLGLLFVASCTHKIAPPADSNRVKNENSGMEMYAIWVKDKQDKFDIEMVMQNTSNEPRIIFLGDISCARGNKSGSLKHTFFNTGERTIDFRPSETKRFVLVCDHFQEAQGPYNLTVRRVYDNPSGDGKTKEKEVGKDLVWSLDPESVRE